MSGTSRERFLQTINHQDPGDVVVDLGAASTTGIHAEALSNLRRYLGLSPKRERISEPFQLLGEVDEEMRKALGIDIVGIGTNWTIYGFENTGWKTWHLPQGLEVEVPKDFVYTVDHKNNTYMYPCGDIHAKPVAKLPAGGYFFDNVDHTAGEFDEETASAREDFRDDYAVYTDSQLRFMEEQIDYYYKNTDYALFGAAALTAMGDMAYIPGPAQKLPRGIRSPEDWLVAHYTVPEYVHECYEMQLETAMKNVKLLKEAAGNKIQAVFVSGTDLGTQRSQYISNDMYREFYLPYHKKLNDWIHQNTEWKVFFHSCGAIEKLMPELYEAGVDILNPVQCSADGMDPVMLKEKWGDKFVFWGGGVDTQKTLPFGTPEEVYAEVLERLKIFAPGGGFVFNTIHNIQGPTKPENIYAMFEAVRDYNRMTK
ncbi:MAG: uroporphyrinogen decarboxylase family protein [Muricomes sp.]|uniref:uroporphyrinogen decarboxylase family protein n=1 Tax=Faecalicatena contorta TaxID=39482 RepID=UPI002ECA87D8|nr:uroporphyrinogen decarboxylase family protein [Muricomes sp.]